MARSRQPPRPSLMSARATLRASRPTTQGIPLGAPLGGWNTRDPIEGMEPTDAIVLDNWYPDVAGIQVRKGSQFYYDLETAAPVYSLMSFQAGSVAKFLAASAGGIWDVSSTNTALTQLASGYASNKWQSTNINSKLIFVNGVDPAQSYDGTTITAAAFTGTTDSEFVDCGTFHNRIFLWKAAEAGFWYGGVNAVTGAVTFFDFSSVAPDGGNLVTVQPFSYDGGQGINAFTAFLLDSGELLLYQGTDPSNASNWSLIGRYVVGLPVGRRAICRQGGDLYWTTSEDYQKLSVLIAALAQGVVPPLSKASGAVKTAVASGSTLFGWDAIYYPAGRRLIFNVPETDGTYSQHVLNTATNAWCRYRGYAALCWAVHAGKPYFGTADGIILLADAGNYDIAGQTLPPWDTSPWDTTPWDTPIYQPIVARGQQAWNVLQSVQYKRVAMGRPVISAMGRVNFQFGVGFDYVDPLVSTATIIQPQTAPWDVSPWDVTPWGSTWQADIDWHVSGGIGTAVSVSVNVNALQPISWVRTDLRVEPGAAL